MHPSHDWRQASIEGGDARCFNCGTMNFGGDQHEECPEASDTTITFRDDYPAETKLRFAGWFTRLRLREIQGMARRIEYEAQRERLRNRLGHAPYLVGGPTAGDIDLMMPPFEELTCRNCSEAFTCRFAWDVYNTNEDCLAEK